MPKHTASAIVPVTPTKAKAKTKASTKPMNDYNEDDIIKYFRALFKPPEEWKRADTAGQCLARYIAVQDAWIVLTDGIGAKKPSRGGWKLPSGMLLMSVVLMFMLTKLEAVVDHEQFPGAHFRKDMVHQALNIRKGTANADNILFTVESDAQRLFQDWIDSPDSAALQAKFGKMSRGDLQQWKQHHKHNKIEFEQV